MAAASDGEDIVNDSQALLAHERFRPIQDCTETRWQLSATPPVRACLDPIRLSRQEKSNLGRSIIILAKTVIGAGKWACDQQSVHVSRST